jgi:hypothetical protein
MGGTEVELQVNIVWALARPKALLTKKKMEKEQNRRSIKLMFGV